MTAALLFASGVAGAQDLQIIQSPVLEGQAGTFTANGVGAPAIVYDRLSRRYVMVFESKLSGADSECPVGRWALGVATSADGRNWNVHPDPILGPTDGTYYHCVAAHPSAIIENGQLHVWFKAEQERFPCATGRKPWGCRVKTGVGYATMNLGTFDEVATTAAPVVNLWAFGYPTVRKVDDTYHMYVAHVRGTYHVTAPAAQGPWTRDTVPVITPGQTWWSQDEIFNPTMTCDEGDFPYRLFVGGRNVVGGVIELGGFGTAVSADGTDFLLSEAPWFTFAGNEPWRHWDVMNVGPSDYLVWFSERGADGKFRIGLAGTKTDWTRNELGRCEVDPAPSTGSIAWRIAQLIAEAEAYGGDVAEDGVEELEEALAHYLNGDTADMVKALEDAIDEIEDEGGSSVEYMLDEAAMIAIISLEEHIDRGESIGGPNDGDVEKGYEALDEALDEYDDEKWGSAAGKTENGHKELNYVGYDGDYCPSEIYETYLDAMCDLQLELAIFDATSGSHANNAVKKLEDTLEELSDLDMRGATLRARQAGKQLEQGGHDGTLVADAMLGAVRQWLDDFRLFDPSSNDLEQAEYLFDQAEIANATGDFLTALELLEDIGKDLHADADD